jgi:uncharacterized protein YecE (DUF72 family)
VIYVGTCGYGYKDWIGSFYPAKIKSAEMLPYYARRFRAVEIDSSYYGVPTAATISAMNARTPGDFRFSFKAPRSVTHPDDIGAAMHDDGLIMRERLEPLRAAGKLAAVLLQFPNAFRPDARSESYLARAAGVFSELPLVAEFRHRDWQQPRTFDMLTALSVGWSNVDLPALESLPRPSSDAIGDVGYVRLHGRNAAQWWTGDNVTRYDYAYSMEELAPWAERVAEIAAQTNETFVMFNNHARGRAAENAEMLEELLEERLPSDAIVALARPSIEPAPEQHALPGFE